MNQALAHFHIGFTMIYPYIFVVFHSQFPVLKSRTLAPRAVEAPGWDPVPFSYHGMICGIFHPWKYPWGWQKWRFFTHCLDVFGLWLGLLITKHVFVHNLGLQMMCVQNESGSTKQKISSHESFVIFFRDDSWRLHQCFFSCFKSWDPTSSHQV